jgi:hypothetical protein
MERRWYGGGRSARDRRRRTVWGESARSGRLSMAGLVVWRSDLPGYVFTMQPFPLPTLIIADVLFLVYLSISARSSTLVYSFQQYVQQTLPPLPPLPSSLQRRSNA